MKAFVAVSRATPCFSEVMSSFHTNSFEKYEFVWLYTAFHHCKGSELIGFPLEPPINKFRLAINLNPIPKTWLISTILHWMPQNCVNFVDQTVFIAVHGSALSKTSVSTRKRKALRIPGSARRTPFLCGLTEISSLLDAVLALFTMICLNLKMILCEFLEFSRNRQQAVD